MVAVLNGLADFFARFCSLFTFSKIAACLAVIQIAFRSLSNFSDALRQIKHLAESIVAELDLVVGDNQQALRHGAGRVPQYFAGPLSFSAGQIPFPFTLLEFGNVKIGDHALAFRQGTHGVDQGLAIGAGKLPGLGKAACDFRQAGFSVAVEVIIGNIINVVVPIELDDLLE
jgi:hypothetical protein